MKKFIAAVGGVIIGAGLFAHGGILPASRGGTGAALIPAAGSLPYSTSSGLALLAGQTLGYVLTSGGTLSAPYWNATSSITSFGNNIVIGTGATVGTGFSLAQGTVSAVPMFIAPGTTLGASATKVGAIEADGSHLYWTDVTGVRHRLDN